MGMESPDKRHFEIKTGVPIKVTSQGMTHHGKIGRVTPGEFTDFEIIWNDDCAHKPNRTYHRFSELKDVDNMELDEE